MKPRNLKKAFFEEIFFVPHAHFDLSWLGTPAECEESNNRIIAAALDILEREKEYEYSIEAVRPVERFLAAHPDQKGRVGKFLAEGRLEIGGLYVDVACDYCFDESLARNFILGRQYLEKEFSYSPELAREEDVLSHFAQAPQLMRLSGMKYFKITRGPKGVYLWEGPDGSRVPTALFEYGDSFHFQLGVDPEKTEKNLPFYLDWVSKQLVAPLSSLVILDGDDCTMPNSNLIGIVRAWNERHESPKLRISGLADYLRSIPEDGMKQIKGDIPGVWGFVIMFEREAAAKMWEAEVVLTAAEKFDSFSAIENKSAAASLKTGWKLLLTAQDHNWGGKNPSKHGPAADAEKVVMLDAAVHSASLVLDAALANISSRIRHERAGIPIVVFNPLSWGRKDFVSLKIPKCFKGEHIAIVDARGDGVQFQEEKNGDERTAGFIADAVPALGYRSYYLIIKEPAVGVDDRRKSVEPLVLENEFYRIGLSPKGNGLKSIYDKKLSRSIVGGTGNPLRAAGIGPRFLSLFGAAVRFTTPSADYYEKEENVTKAGTGEGIKFLGKLWPGRKFSLKEMDKTTGPVYDEVQWRGEFIGSEVFYNVRLYHDIKRMDFKVELDWAGVPGVMIFLLFPLAISGETWVNTPYYVHKKGREAEGFWKTPGVPIQPKMRSVYNWFSVCSKDAAVTISSPHRLWDFTFFPVAPLIASDDQGGFFTGERYLQKGKHEFVFSMSSDAGDWKAARGYEKGLEPIYKMMPRVGAAAEGGAKPVEGSFCRVEPDNVVVTAVQASPKGDALNVRFYEAVGTPGRAELEFPWDVSRAEETDLLGNTINEAEAAGKSVLCNFHAYEIKNLKVSF